MSTKNSQPVPFLNLKKLFLDHRDEFSEAIFRVLDRGAYIGGDELGAFEKGFAAWVAGKPGSQDSGYFAVGSANGTDAITVAAHSLGLPKGSEAIVPAMTYMATAEGLMNAGFKVKLVDVSPGTWLMDLDKLERAITHNTRLIAPVHLYGQMAEMDRIKEIANRHHCLILEDAAQAHGALWKDKPVGHWGDIATYSFYPGKNLGAFGDAGAILSRDKQKILFCQAMGNHGGLKKYEHDMLGFNSRLDNLQAAVLGVKLKYIDGWNESRRRVARAYQEALSNIPGLELPIEKAGAKHVFHIYAIVVEKREELMAYLKEQGIESGIHYPKAVHQLGAFREHFGGQSFPNAERIAAHGMSLPMCPTLGPDEIGRVTKAVRSYFGK